MSAEQLQSSLSCDKDGNLYEADYQKQFYAAASIYLPAGFRISPEVGQVTHAGGSLERVFGLLSLGVRCLNPRKKHLLT